MRVKTILYSLVLLLLIMALVFACAEGVVMDIPFYESEYAALDTAAELGMSHGDLMAATERLLDYMDGVVPDLDVSAAVHGQTRQVFNQRERDHMVDVAALFRGWMRFESFAVALACVVGAVMWFLVRERRARFFARCYRNAAVVFGAVLIVIALWVLADFNSFWTAFHLLFFRNDLWLLDPATSIMINMFPETFFLHMVRRIVLRAVSVVGLPLLVSLAYLGLPGRESE